MTVIVVIIDENVPQFIISLTERKITIKKDIKNKCYEKAVFSFQRGFASERKIHRNFHVPVTANGRCDNDLVVYISAVCHDKIFKRMMTSSPS